MLERIWQLEKCGEFYVIFVIKVSSKIHLLETVLLSWNLILMPTAVVSRNWMVNN